MALVAIAPVLLVITGFGLHTVPMIVLTGATGVAIQSGMN